MNTLTATNYATVGPATGRSAVAGQPLGLYFPSTDERMVASPEDAHAVLAPLVHGADREMCVVALLTTKHRLIGTKVTSIGTVDHTFMAPRDVYREALLANASAIVVAHNHPSGDASPSQDDEAVARRLSAAGDLIGVDLLDSLVFAGERWTSLARQGVI